MDNLLGACIARALVYSLRTVASMVSVTVTQFVMVQSLWIVKLTPKCIFKLLSQRMIRCLLITKFQKLLFTRSFIPSSPNILSRSTVFQFFVGVQFPVLVITPFGLFIETHCCSSSLQPSNACAPPKLTAQTET